MNDIVRLARGLTGPFCPFESSSLTLNPDFESRFYIRISVTHTLGVIGTVGTLASENGVSINSVLQNPVEDADAPLNLVVTTDKVKLSQLKGFVNAMESAPCVLERPMYMVLLKD